jgi:streptomycin 6-kinase
MTTFRSNIISIYRKQGESWLDELPELVTAISSKLDLRDLKEVSNLTYNYVLSGFQGDNPIILKLGLDSEGLAREAFALNCFAGYGAVKVLAKDDLPDEALAKAGGMLLLERSVPGTSLKSYFPDKEQESIEIVCGVMKKLHLPTPRLQETSHFPHMKDWLTALDKDWPIPDGYLKKARKLRDQLLQTSEPDVLLHGDLHHDNILQNGNDWVVIDPKGVIGSPINEVWAFVMDIERDIPFIAQYFNYRTQDLFDWYFVHVILAACWNLEDNIDTNLFLRLAEKAHKYVS